MTEYVNKIIVPMALNNHNKTLEEKGMPAVTRVEFLQSFHLLKGRPRKTYDEDDDDDDEVVTESRVFPLPPNEDISGRTITNWLNNFGYSYDVARKHYYSDTHEHPMTIADRTRFVHRVLFVYEPRAERWIQVRKDLLLFDYACHPSYLSCLQVRKNVAERYKLKNVVPQDAGIEFTDESGGEWVEFSVDDSKTFAREVRQHPEEYKYGGKRSRLFINAPTSIVNDWVDQNMFKHDELEPSKAGYHYELQGVQMTEVHALHFKRDHETREKLRKSMEEHELAFHESVRQPLIIFGQDEAIFKQYLLTLKLWLGRKKK